MLRHKFDAVSFVLGVLVIGLGITFVAGIHGASWMAPVLLSGIGLAWVVGGIQRTIESHEAKSESGR